MKYRYDKEFKGIVCTPDCASEWMEYICDIACGYDGCNTVESLKGLIDEMVEATSNAIICIDNGKVLSDGDETFESYKQAKKDQEEDMEV